MADPLPTFPLFQDPVREKSFVAGPDACDRCGQSRGWVYTGPIFSESDEDPTLCPHCIADGSAAEEFGCTFNDGSVENAGDEDVSFSDDDLDLVERRTPGFTTWQDHGWILCCGKPAMYLGEADSQDLRGRWSAAVPSILASSNHDEADKDEQAEIINSITRGESPAAYVFQCRSCNKLHGFWDAD